MVLLINLSNLQSGGGLQVAASLLREWSKTKEHQYHILCSQKCNAHLQHIEWPEHFTFYTLNYKANKNPISLNKFKRWADRIVKQNCVNAVFTVFGPAFWKPKVAHLVGFANGFYLFNDATIIQELHKKKIIRTINYKLKRKLILRQLKAEAQLYWVETISAQKALVNAATIPIEQIHVISNTYDSNLKPRTFQAAKEVFTLVYPSAYYAHKNFERLAKLILKLQEAKIQVKFRLSLEEEIFQQLFKTCSSVYVENIGFQNHTHLHQIYHQADALFMPSLLETFSATLTEAMYIGLPILCAQLEFNTTLCGQAALYFDPYNVEDMFEKIKLLITNPDMQEQLIEKGKQQLKTFDSPQSRATKLLHLLTTLSKTKSNLLCVES